jgi:hypothetical protein
MGGRDLHREFGCNGRDIPNRRIHHLHNFITLLRLHSFLVDQENVPWYTSLASYVVQSIIWCYFYGGLFKMANKSVRGEKLALADILSGRPVAFQFLIYGQLYNLSVVASALACCVGTCAIELLILPGASVLADGGKATDAISKSFHHMKLDWVNAGAFNFVLGLLQVAGCFPVGLGLFITFPMCFIIASLAYRDIVGMPRQAGGIARPDEKVQIDPGAWPPPPNGV